MVDFGPEIRTRSSSSVSPDYHVLSSTDMGFPVLSVVHRLGYSLCPAAVGFMCPTWENGDMVVEFVSSGTLGLSDFRVLQVS